MNFTREILILLKGKYEKATGKTMKHDSKMQSSQAEFYFESLTDNLIEPMKETALKEYGDGSGNELAEKMRALRSSSAMTYNLLGNGTVIIKTDNIFDKGSYEVHFEKQLATIKNNPHKANLDACLEGKTEFIFCEMKMTEWLFNKPGSISERYLDKTLYYDKESYSAFRVCIDSIKNPEPSDYRTFESVFKQYDAFQMFKHTLAIYNYAYENRGNIPNKIRLVNCVWELNNLDCLSREAQATFLEKAECEHKEFNAFYATTKDIRDRFLNIGYDFDIIYMDASEFVKQFQKTESEKEYLKRYF